MHTYCLKFEANGTGPTDQIEFEADGAGEALIFDHLKARKRSAELWCDEEKLCSIHREGPGFWTISPAQ